MKILNNVQEGIFQIRDALIANVDLRKLLYYSTSNALTLQDDPANSTYMTEVNSRMVVAAVFDTTEPPFDKSTIVSISLSRGNYEEEKVLLSGIVKINVLTQSDIWQLDNRKIRPLEISNIIIDILNNRKISSSHKLLFSNIELAILNENVNGYAISFFLEEGSGLDEQF
jgi:chemotaxis signal transduction protein